MKKNKIALSLSLFSTGLTGVLVGAFIVNKPILDTNPSYALNPKTVLTMTENKASLSPHLQTTDIAEKLSQDFIKISREVTPAIVSINSTKIVKNGGKYHQYLDDPMFKKFFDIPGHKMPDDEGTKQQGLGSGVIVDKEGIILTNNHVITGADDITVTLTDKRVFKAKLIGADPKTDVAVIKIEKAKDLPVAKIGDSNKISVGEWVLAIGNPLGLTSTVTSGIVSAKSRGDVGVADFEDFIQTDAAINPGNSGGALINLQGEVIGINTAIASRTGGYMGIGFAIPSNMAKKVMNDLITKGKVVRGFLGIQIQNMTPSFAKSLNVENPNKGIVIGDVLKDSPAYKAGLKRYDVVLELNDKEVLDVNSFRNAIASMNPGEPVKLEILRDGKKQNVKVSLSELDTGKQASKNEAKIEDLGKKLGFEVEPLTPEILKQLEVDKNTDGVVVIELNSNSNAAEAGLGRGDIIQEVNKQNVSNQEDFNRAIKNLKSGDSVLLKVKRGKADLLLAFTLK